MTNQGEIHQQTSVRGGPSEVEPSAGPGGPRLRARAQVARSPRQHRRQHSPRQPRRRVSAPHRGHRRVGDAGRRRQGEGAQGGRPAGDRLRRRRAGLPDPGLHRRGRRRGVPRPAQPPLHPGRRAARAQAGDRRQDRARLRLRRRAGPGAGHQRRQAGGLRGLRDAPRPGRRGARCRRRTGRPTRRRSGWPAACRSRCSPTRPRTTWSPSSSSRRPRTDRDQGAAVLLAVEPDRRGLPAERGRGDRPLGARARALGGHRRDLRAPDATAAPSTCSMPVAVPELADRCVVRQRRRQDLRDDRLAGRLDDRPEGRDQGRHQPAVARDLERRQRAAAGRDRRARPAT